MSVIDDRFVAWDVETLRLSHEVAGGWRNPAGFGLAVAVTQDHLGVTHTWEEKDAHELIDYLTGYPKVIGFNSRRFDNKVLSAYGDISGVDGRTLDLPEDISKAANRPHPVSLDRLSETVLGKRKLFDDATEAVRVWRSGRLEDRELVIRYCTRDVELTMENYEFGCRYGFVLIPVDGMSWGDLPVAARVPVTWGEPPGARLIEPEPLNRQDQSPR